MIANGFQIHTDSGAFLDDLLRTAMQRILQMNQLPKVFDLSSADLNFRHRDKNLIANNFHFRRAALGSHALLSTMQFLLEISLIKILNIPVNEYHELLALTKSLLAQENDSFSENKTQSVQLQSLLDFPQEIGYIQPFNTIMIEQVGWTQIERLLARFLMLTEKVIEYGAIFFVDALHLIDVLGHI